MTDAVSVNLVATGGTVLVALVANWVTLRQYRRKVSADLRAEAMQSYLTDEQLQAEFRKEIRDEMQRLREKDEHRDLAYRKLEDENSDLRRQVASLDIEVMRLRAQLDAHRSDALVSPPGVTTVTTATVVTP